MRILGAVALTLAMPSVALAVDQQSYRSAPLAHSAPAYRPSQHTNVQPTYRAPVERRTVRHLPAHFTPPFGTTAGRVPHHQRTFPPDHRTVIPHHPPRHFSRPVVRTVRLHGGLLAVPAVIAIGVPVILEVPGIGSVSVDEERYRELYDLLASENADNWERAYTELQQIKQSEVQQIRQSEVPTESAGYDDSGASNAGPTNMLPPGFRVVHPTTASEPGVDLPEDPQPMRRARSLY